MISESDWNVESTHEGIYAEPICAALAQMHESQAYR